MFLLCALPFAAGAAPPANDRALDRWIDGYSTRLAERIPPNVGGIVWAGVCDRTPHRDALLVTLLDRRLAEAITARGFRLLSSAGEGGIVVKTFLEEKGAHFVLAGEVSRGEERIAIVIVPAPRSDIVTEVEHFRHPPFEIEAFSTIGAPLLDLALCTTPSGQGTRRWLILLAERSLRISPLFGGSIHHEWLPPPTAGEKVRHPTGFLTAIRTDDGKECEITAFTSSGEETLRWRWDGRRLDREAPIPAPLLARVARWNLFLFARRLPGTNLFTEGTISERPSPEGGRPLRSMPAARRRRSPEPSPEGGDEIPGLLDVSGAFLAVTPFEGEGLFWLFLTPDGAELTDGAGTRLFLPPAGFGSSVMRIGDRLLFLATAPTPPGAGDTLRVYALAPGLRGEIRLLWESPPFSGTLVSMALLPGSKRGEVILGERRGGETILYRLRSTPPWE
ncbi:MAG: hypothetical protein D6795_13740 [Deltaproteobacteria bacterium]|nr:MAG: hypothetical protein D6795_13740 [Deltaproteobacteria bacterium]